MRTLLFAFICVIFLGVAATSKEKKSVYFEKIPKAYLENNKSVRVEVLKFAPTLENYNTIVGLIEKGDTNNISYLCSILDSNKSIKMVPAIMRIVDDHRLAYTTFSMWDGPSGSGTFEDEYYVSTLMIAILEKIYHFKFVYDEEHETIRKEPNTYFHSHVVRKRKQIAAAWKKLWQTNGRNYKNWGQEFYKDKLKELQNSDYVEYYQLNFIVESPYRRTKDTTIWKSLLPKIKNDGFLYLKTDDIFKVETMEQLEHLIFDKQSFIEMFKYISDSKSISFEIIQKALQVYADNEQGEIITALLTHEVIKTAIMENPKRSFFTDSYILDKIKAYRKNPTQTDAFFDLLYLANREDNPQYFIAMSQMKFSEKLSYILDTLKDKLQNRAGIKLIESATYEDLIFIFKNTSDVYKICLSKSVFETLSFSIGIPLYKYNHNDIPTILRILERYDEELLYKRYAKRIYPKLYNGDKLNYELVGKELKSPLKYEYNDVLEFSPVFTLIRALEVEHNTRLGYSYQFPRYDAKQVQSRIDAWLKYLEEKGLINRN